MLAGGVAATPWLARALLSEPGLIIADEPTQGVDVGARAEIYRILREITTKGTPVVINSSDAAELEGLCDKVVVLSRGRVVATLTGEDVVEAKIVEAAVGGTEIVVDNKICLYSTCRCQQESQCGSNHTGSCNQPHHRGGPFCRSGENFPSVAVQGGHAAGDTRNRIPFWGARKNNNWFG